VRGRAPQYGKHRTRVAAARDFARQLRKKSTDAEKRLWRLLRDRRFAEFKFRRQYACGIYYLDFYCTVAKLAVELDGGGHGFPDQHAKDEERNRFLAEQGIKVLRFWNHQLRGELQAVRFEIWHALMERTGRKDEIAGYLPKPAPSPQPSPPSGERESDWRTRGQTSAQGTRCSCQGSTTFGTFRRVSEPLCRLPAIVASLASAAVLAGCVASSEQIERAHLSGEIQQRAGQGIRTESSTTNQLPPRVDLGDGLSEDDAVAIALWNNAAFQENLSKLGLARGDLAQAGLLSNPSFSILFPLGPKQLEFAATFPLEALWLRPRRVAIVKIDAERVAAGLLQNGLDLVRDVRAGFSDFELAQDRLRWSRDAVVLRERIAEITEARQRAGEGNELDTLAARAEVARARDDAQRFAHDVTVAQERLLFLLGWNDAGKTDFAPTTTPPALINSLDDLERQALAARPDLRACELALEAAGKRAGLAKAEIFALSGIIDANGSGKEGFEIGPGAQLPIPVFNQNQAGRARAAAEIERAAWSCIGAQQRIRLEVREAHLKHQQAAEAAGNFTEKLLPQLEELVRRSEKAYELGEMSPLAVQENARQLLIARVRQAELTAELRRAWAELERSVGTSLRTETK